jgi:Holliday junction resolvase RusA-like endonuclease
MKLKLTLPVPVSLNKLYVNEYKYNNISKKREPTGARVLSAEGKKCKQLIQKQVKQQLKRQSWDYEYVKNKYLYIDLVFIFSRMGRDSDNCLKLLQDSLQGIVFENDSHVLCRVQKVMFSVDEPRVEATVSLVSFIGIFDNQEELDQFESVCKECKRYKRNCSILAKAREGRIQEEIDADLCCSKFNKI